MYQFGSTGVKVRNCAVTIAMAVAVLSSQDSSIQGGNASKFSGTIGVVSVDDVD